MAAAVFAAYASHNWTHCALEREREAGRALRDAIASRFAPGLATRGIGMHIEERLDWRTTQVDERQQHTSVVGIRYVIRFLLPVPGTQQPGAPPGITHPTHVGFDGDPAGVPGAAAMSIATGSVGFINPMSVAAYQQQPVPATVPVGGYSGQLTQPAFGAASAGGLPVYFPGQQQQEQQQQSRQQQPQQQQQQQQPHGLSVHQTGYGPLAYSSAPR